MSFKIIVVQRYDKPEPRFGIHSNEPRGTLKPGVFHAVGLFDFEGARNFFDDHNEVSYYTPTLEEIRDCAPIEWHKLLKNEDNDLKSRFTGFIING